jgi:hypothetical protein
MGIWKIPFMIGVGTIFSVAAVFGEGARQVEG